MSIRLCVRVLASVGWAALLVVGLGPGVVAMNLALISAASAGPNFNCASQAVDQFAAISDVQARNASWYLNENGKDEDPRKTYEQEAKDTGKSVDSVYQKYAATGRLLCPPGSPTTASLVLKNDVIVTAAHAFYDKEGQPKFKKSPHKCQFYVMRKSGRLGPNDEYLGRQDPDDVYEVDLSSLEQGEKKRSNDSDGGKDWAVAKLRRKVVGVEPYPIDAQIESKPFPIEGDSVSAGQLDRDENSPKIHRPSLNNGRFIKDHPNLIHKCRATTSSGPRRNGVWLANCALGDGGSGSPFLVNSMGAKNPFAISAIGMDSPPESKTGYPYKPGVNSTVYVAIAGKFRAAIFEAAK